VRKTTNTSIVQAEFGKFPFEHFVGLDLWKNDYSRISPMRWQVLCFRFNRR
jgi:hypothetical protein